MSEVFMNDTSFKIKVDHSLNMNDSFKIKVDHDLNINDSFKIKVDHGLPWVVFSNSFKVRVDHGLPNFFPSIRNNDTPTFTEKNSFFSVSAVIQVPELGEDIEIPYNKFYNSKLSRKINHPIICSFTLDNSDRRFTKSTGDFAGLFTRNIYSASRETRKFIKFIVRVFDGAGDLIYTKYYPRMVIKDRTGGIELNITCIDEISYYLNEKVDLPTFTARELLTRDSDDKTFFAFYLTNKFNRFRNSELLSNYFQVRDNQFSYSRGESYDSYVFSSEVNEQFAVEAICPLYIKEVIKAICNGVIDKQPDTIQKEYFPVIMNFEDWQTRFNIPVQNQTALSVINPLISCIPGEYYIKPNENNLSLVIQEADTVDNYPDTGKYTFTPQNSRGDFSVSYSGQNAFNRINIVKPNETGTAYKQVN